MKQGWMRFLSIVLAVSLTGCSTPAGKKEKREAKYQKEPGRISLYEKAVPSGYSWFDYRERALAYDRLVFSGDSPYMWRDDTYDTFGIPAYVGDKRMGKDGGEEAVTVMAAILSATLLGLDKSSREGANYVDSLYGFYSGEEKIILNSPGGSSADTSMWYLLYPAVLFTQISVLYPDEERIREAALSNINSWYEAYQVMMGENSFDYTGFNFKTGRPWKNNIWTEPDSAAGIAVLLYYGYELTGEEKYLEGAKECLNWLAGYFGSPLYEALMYFAPGLSALFNARFGTDCPTGDFIDDILNGSSIPRGGWGGITGKWGKIRADGLMGSTTDGGGYAFAMNTFAAAYAMSLLAKYDTRYAAAMGKWYLNLSGNARYFFPDETEKENQSQGAGVDMDTVIEASEAAIPFEGIRKSYQSKTPWAGGDPTVYGWADTDLSLYSGAHTGLLGAILEQTDVEGILKVDLTKADIFHREFQASLIYNPWDEEKTVAFRLGKAEPADLYDSVSGTCLAKNVNEECRITIPSGEAAVIWELPAGCSLERRGNSLFAGNVLIASNQVSVSVTNYENNEEVSGSFRLEAQIKGAQEGDRVKEAVVAAGEQEYNFRDLENMKFSVKELGEGSKTFTLRVVMESGLTDSVSIRLKLRQ